MNQYYLMAQLPSLDGLDENTPIPITEERFYEVANRFLSAKQKKSLEDFSIVPNIDLSSSNKNLLDKWCNFERDLRLSLAKVRGEKLKKAVDIGDYSPSPTLFQMAKNVVEMDNPLEAEMYLNKYRLDYLEDLRPIDSFSEDALFYYAIKLKLLLRMQKFQVEIGKNAYQEIYSSILNGRNQEN